MSDVVAERIAEVRRKRGMNVKQLAERCAELGAPELTAHTLYNLESGRRDKDGRRRREVTVDELLKLAYVLSVAPVHLLVPPVDGNEVVPYQFIEGVTTTPGFARAWIRGQTPIGRVVARDYFSEVPDSEFEVPRGQWTPESIEAQSDAVRKSTDG
ncbi:helix-turn-helix domain-containing protein [Streptomyces sp. CAI-85]|uniref:helix-turn-helix domain-containing protein n=1 Tax=Streptomyces sp. CAI-85 TaxID=1472662 RepID=UPI00158758BB|nr:helix-turn-helix transcriptional regulator [Streptomyces sp. CAI-85]NUV63248.1 helix-turn-helix transcriptional regulator [Streptomyces sp. CAI-85]